MIQFAPAIPGEMAPFAALRHLAIVVWATFARPWSVAVTMRAA